MPNRPDTQSPLPQPRPLRIAAVAVIVGMISAWLAGFFLLLLSAVETAHVAKMTAQSIFGGFVVLGLAMALGGWWLRLGSTRGYYLTLAASALGLVLAGACLVQALIVRRTFEYNLMGFTVPMVTYAALGFVLLRCGPPTPDFRSTPSEAAAPAARSPNVQR